MPIVLCSLPPTSQCIKSNPPDDHNYHCDTNKQKPMEIVTLPGTRQSGSASRGYIVSINVPLPSSCCNRYACLRSRSARGYHCPALTSVACSIISLIDIG